MRQIDYEISINPATARPELDFAFLNKAFNICFHASKFQLSFFVNSRGRQVGREGIPVPVFLDLHILK